MKNFDNKAFLPFASLVLGLALFSACKEEFDHTIDTANPVIVSYNPSATAEGIAVSSNLVLTFDEVIKKGTGTILISSEKGSQTIEVTSDAVVISADKRILIINPPNDLEPDEHYTVKIDQGIVTDLLGNKYIGTPGGFSWTFKTVGTSGLALTALNPIPGSNDASLFKLELNFAADIVKGSGNITVFETMGNVKVAELSVAGQAVQLNGKRMTVRLNTPLKFATSYYVLADAGAVLDAQGKSFEGFLSPESWSFSTISGSGNSLVAYLPMDNDLSDASGNRFDAMSGDNASAQVSFINDPERGRVASFVAGSYAVLPKHDLLRPALTQSFSFSIWVKMKGIGSDPAIFSNSNWDSGGLPGFVLATDDANNYTAGPGSSGRGWLLKLAGDAGGVANRMDWRASEMSPQAPAVGDDKWHMLTVVVNQATKRLHVYLDAKEYSKATPFDLNNIKGPLWHAAQDYPFTIWEDGSGVYNSGDDTRKTLSGLVDDVRIYNKALSPEEVTGIFLTD
ncbi:Ig-like domain-containing protein [Pedobacter sp. AW31-3R]|uniref:Ig-like domain-containing protein n=1 Tax=Pedobacter sp. AW31-3R TaxID=3445781 RepID=UPI003FA03D3D